MWAIRLRDFGIPFQINQPQNVGLRSKKTRRRRIQRNNIFMGSQLFIKEVVVFVTLKTPVLRIRCWRKEWTKL